MEVRKTVTVLFADVTGSTALGERLDPESLRGVMSRYFEEMRSAVERHGGTVEKFIGDAVMAVFGVPTVHEDDALRAVRAASEMRELLASLNAELERDWGARLQIRTGINTGEVVAGDPSAGQSFVTGDTVNVAARLEQAAEPDEILIGEATHGLVRDAVVVEPVDPLELKGKADRVPAFRLVDVTPGAPAVTRHLDSPLVGREQELARLERALDEAVARRACRVATVVGDAGLGKSRLVTEFVARAAGRARVLWSRCLPYGEGITFWPIAELVARRGDDRRRRTRRRWRARRCAACSPTRKTATASRIWSRARSVWATAEPGQTSGRRSGRCGGCSRSSPRRSRSSWWSKTSTGRSPPSSTSCSTWRGFSADHAAGAALHGAAGPPRAAGPTGATSPSRSCSSR